MKRLDTHLETLTEALGSDGHDHELLQIERVIRMHAAVDDVHHRHRQHVGIGSTDPLEQLDARTGSGGVGSCKRCAKDGIGAEATLGRRAVKFDQCRVERALVGSIHSAQAVGNLAVDVTNRVRDTLAAPGRATVAELNCLPLTRRRTRWHSSMATRTILEHDIDLNGRIATRVEDLSSVNRGDCAHAVPSSGAWSARRVFAAR